MVSPAIKKLLEQENLDSTAIDHFLAEHQFPIREGRSVTFVFRGEADSVRLRHWIFSLPTSQPLERIPNTNLWHLTLEIPERSRVEYKFIIEHHGRESWVADPLNARVAHDPFGSNSVCQTDGYVTPDWVEHDPQARPGVLDEHELRDTPWGDTRRLTVYRPARFRTTRRYGLLVVHDGQDYLDYARMKTVLDNLIHRLEIQPLVVAFTHPKDRLIEYADDATHNEFIVKTLLPYVDAHYPLLQSPSARCLMGASFGGVASLSTAWHYPGMFGRLLLQSGSFAFTDIGGHKRGPRFDPVVRFVNAFRNNPGKPSERVYLSCGVYESLIYENRSLVPWLQDTGMDVRFEETRDGHNWENWRDRLQTALSWLFPGPLWMVYE